MADENEFELEEGEDINKFQKRITSLSSKVKQTADERDAFDRKAQEADAGRAAAEKERDFYAGFSGLYAKYPNAAEFTDKIKEKVMAGYTVEDATVSILNAEGKLVAAPPAPPPPPPPAGGGSAGINLPDGGQKELGDMTRDEKRAALMEAERRGDIRLT